MNKLTINVKQIIEFFGGVSSVIEKLKPYKEISRGGVEKWRERKSVPSDALLAFVLVAKTEKRDFDLCQFIETK